MSAAVVWWLYGCLAASAVFLGLEIDALRRRVKKLERGR